MADAVSAPLAIDLFCGLLQAEFRDSADFAVEKLVTGRAENPDHVTQAISHQPASTVSLVRGLVRNLNDATFAARLACFRKIRIFSVQPRQSAVLERAVAVVNLLRGGITAMECAALYPTRLCGAILRAVPGIGARRNYVEVLAACSAIATSLSNVSLLMTPQTAGTGLAWERTVSLVRPFCPEGHAAQRAEQIIHGCIIA